MMRARWNLTVCSTTPKSAAICLLSFPAASAAEHVALARSEACEPLTKVRGVGHRVPRRSVLLDRGAHRGNQRPGLDRLGQEIRRARLDGAHRHRDVAVPADEHDRQRFARGGEPLLQLEAVEARHRDVEHEAPFRLRAPAGRGTPPRTRTSRRSSRPPATRATSACSTPGSSSTRKMVGAAKASVMSRLHRQDNGKRRSAFRVVGRDDAAMMRGYDRLADRKPDAHAAGLGAVERIEHSLKVAFGNPVPIIGHVQANVRSLRFGPELETALGDVDPGHRIGGIQDEIEHHLLQLDASPVDGRDSAGARSVRGVTWRISNSARSSSSVSRISSLIVEASPSSCRRAGTAPPGGE